MRLRERRARHALPEHLRVVPARHAVAEIRTRDRPARLRDPHPGAGLDAADHVAHALHALPEDVVAVGDGGALPVGVAVRADEVARLDHGRVGAVHPRRPRVHVADLHAAGPEGAQHAADVVDLARERARARLLAVEVLAAHAHRDDPIVAVLLDRGLQGGFFRGEVVAVFGPDADEEFGARGEGGGHGVGERVAVGGGVEAGGGEGAGEGAEDVEVFGPVGLGFAGAGREVGAEVEAFPVGGCEGEEGKEEGGGGEVHFLE